MAEELEAEFERGVSVLRETVSISRALPDYHNADEDVAILKKFQGEVAVMIAAWQIKEGEKHSLILDLQQQVALAERNLVSAKREYSLNSEVVDRVREELAQAQNRERQKQDDLKDLEECIEAIEEQLHSIKMQKETFEKPDADEAFLKNELSLFLNVSSILPDLGDPKFSGTFVDKQKGLKTFKFTSADMSPFQTCRAAWDMMK